MSDFGEWLPKVLITLKTNICFTVFLLAPRLCNYRSAKNHVFTRNKKVDTLQRIVIKKEINKNFLTLAITSTCPSQSLGKIPGFEVAGAILMKTGRSPFAKSHMVKRLGFLVFTQAARVRLPLWERFFYFASIIPAFQLFIPMFGNDFQRW